MKDNATQKLLSALESNWQAEMDGFHTYSALAKDAPDPHRRNALRGLATAEKHHADLWAERIRQLGGTQPEYRGAPSGQADSLANRVGGPDLALRRLEIDEGRDIAKYGKQIKSLGDEPSVAILNEVIADERDHYLTLSNLIRSRGALPALPPEQAQAALDELVAAREKGQRQAAGWVGDAIYGINDGLGSIFGIVSGVSRRDVRQQSLRPHRRPRRHGRERPVDGLWCLPCSQKRARDLRRRIRKGKGSSRGQRSRGARTPLP